MGPTNTWVIYWCLSSQHLIFFIPYKASYWYMCVNQPSATSTPIEFRISVYTIQATITMAMFVARFNLTIHRVPESSIGYSIGKSGFFCWGVCRAFLSFIHLVVWEGVHLGQVDKNVIVRARRIFWCSVGFETRKTRLVTYCRGITQRNSLLCDIWDHYGSKFHIYSYPADLV